jgi:hypothetical protein
VKRREFYAGLLGALLVVVGCTFAIVRTQQPSALTAPERKELMEASDMLNTRLYQQVNDTATVNPNAGVGGSASVDGNDAVGQVNLTTGSNPQPGEQVHIYFAKPYQIQPFVMLTPEDQSPPPDYYVTIDTNGWAIVLGSAAKPNTNYPFAYFIAPRPWLMYLGEK